MSDFLSFRLADDFVNTYKDRPVEWGLPVGEGHNHFGELVFIDKYSRLKADGQKERWHEVCRRVVEGTFSILKDHVQASKTHWNANKAVRSAEQMYDRMFHFKWTPPGRGMWMMGTEFVNSERDAGPLYNCAALDFGMVTKRDPGYWFARLLEMCMYGIGVGYTTELKREFPIYAPSGEPVVHTIADSREGWAEGLRLYLNSYLMPGKPPVELDYSLIRPAGSPLKRFGGVASGPEPFEKSISIIGTLLSDRVGELLTDVLVVDINNLVAKAAVSGGSRRSALLSTGTVESEEWLSIKDWNAGHQRTQVDGWAWMSNNSVLADVKSDLSSIFTEDLVLLNGEPGVLFLDMARNYGRLTDGKDYADPEVVVTNPCGEIFLPHCGVCNLTETYPVNHETKQDFLETLKYAYLYAKAVTLLPTPWAETNAVIGRERRIGTSMTGVADFLDEHLWVEWREWMDEGYNTVRAWDKIYSSWLGIRESIRTTTLKPAGSTSTIAGCSPGQHFPVASGKFFRRQRIPALSPLVNIYKAAGYHVEPARDDPATTQVVTFPVTGRNTRAEHEVSVWEKAALAADTQRYWSDNAGSVTLTFHKESEGPQLPALMQAFQGKLKGCSFYPMNAEFAQPPFEKVSEEVWDTYAAQLLPVPLDVLYANATDASGALYCDAEACEVPHGN